MNFSKKYNMLRLKHPVPPPPAAKQWFITNIHFNRRCRIARLQAIYVARACVGRFIHIIHFYKPIKLYFYKELGFPETRDWLDSYKLVCYLWFHYRWHMTHANFHKFVISKSCHQNSYFIFNSLSRLPYEQRQLSNKCNLSLLTWRRLLMWPVR